MKAIALPLAIVILSGCGGGGGSAGAGQPVNLNGDFAPAVISTVPVAPVAGAAITVQISTAYDGIQGAGAGTFDVPVSISRNGGAAYARGVVTFTRASGSSKVGTWAGAGSVQLPGQTAGLYVLAATLDPTAAYDFVGTVNPGAALSLTVAP